MRLFVAAWPVPEVAMFLATLARPRTDGVRWTAPDQWHVTLAFLGNAAEEVLDPLCGSLGSALTAHPPPTATLGLPATCLGAVLCLPVDGLDRLARQVRRAVMPWAPGVDRRAYRGHLTLGRPAGRRPLPDGLDAAVRPASGAAVPSWPVGEVAIVRSRPDAGGARYETARRVRLDGAGIGSASGTGDR